jgi:Ca2+-transporting ATPase
MMKAESKQGQPDKNNLSSSAGVSLNPISEDTPAAAGDPQQNKLWHTLEQAEVLRELGTDAAKGLTPAEAQRRLGLYGKNQLQEKTRRHWSTMFAAQFTDLMIVILLVAAVIAGFIGEPQDSIAIIVIVLLNAVVGFVQEFRAERVMAALRAMAAHKARVVRAGQVQELEATELVPGDLVMLAAGDVVPADIRLTETARLQAEEAALTGESVPVEKNIAASDDPEATLGDRSGMVYKSTLVTDGRGCGVVVATGMQTELGRIAALLSTESGKTPLQKRLARFGRRLAGVVIVICAILFISGWLRGEPLVTLFLTAVSLAVAAIPEALPAVVTISLALGAARMVRQQVLIRRLPAVETLGSVTYICTDKTGTLTENRMQAVTFYAAGNTGNALSELPDWHKLGRILALCNDAGRDAGGELRGDPTEIALLAAVPEAQQAEWLQHYPRLAELPFDSVRARMSTLHRDGNKVLMLVKGAPEQLLPLCSSQLDTADNSPIDPQTAEVAAQIAASGKRVLACAMKVLDAVPNVLDADKLETDLIFAGLAGLIDPPRPGVQQAVADCIQAGIKPLMITGDHPATASAIAAELGIARPDAPVMTGAELAELSEAELTNEVATTQVFARTNPEQKIRIVAALQSRGEFVAMTGDGVNDAPALKRADIGVAMGRNGTDVAREAASMVLLDDNFATIVRAVREGRRIFDNIRHFVKYTMTSNAGEIWTLFLAPFMGLPIPLLPIHILWINLVTDGLPGLALAAEPAEKNVMDRPPRPPNESMFAHGMWQHILWVGLLIGGLSIMTQAWAISAGKEHWQTMVFTVLTLSQMAHVMAIRSERDSLLKLGLFSNRPLLIAVALSVGLQLAVIYVPALQPIFKTGPLTAGELLFCFAVSAIVFLAVEAEKFCVRRGWLYGSA